MRCRRLEKRVLRRWPMFADQIIREELEKKPEYYSAPPPRISSVD
jgi:hypothetical protein